MGEFTNGVLSRTTSGGTQYIALSDQDLPTNAEVTGASSGGLYPNQLSVTRFDPVGTFTSGSIGAIFDLIALNGTCISPSHTVTGAALISRKLGTCDEPLGATPHYRTACTRGLLRLDTLRASRDQDASISGMLDMFTDGSASPVAITDGVAWPTTIIEDRYRLGLCKFCNVQFPEVEDISLSFNVAITPKRSHLATIWTKTAGVISVTPQLTLRGNDLSRVKTGLIELTGNAATSVNTLLQLVKLIDDASYHPFASTVHTALQITGLGIPANLMNASAGSRATNEIILTGKSVSGAAPVIINTAVAYNSNP